MTTRIGAKPRGCRSTWRAGHGDRHRPASRARPGCVQNAAVAADMHQMRGRAVTFEEARAQFPVLERIAYLNAGTFGPISRRPSEAMLSGARARLRRGPQRDAVLPADRWSCASRCARGSPRSSRPTRSTSRSPSSTTDGCNIVVAGLGLGPDDEIVTTTDEHFGLLGALGASGARVVVVEPEPDAILAAVTPRTRLLALSQVLWTTGRVLPVRELRAETGHSRARRRSTVGRGDPGRRGGPRLPHDLGPEVALRPGFDGRARRRRSRAAAGRGAELLLPGRLRAGRDASSRAPARPASTRTGGRPSSLAGLLAALDGRPAWGFDHAAAVAERCRELLAARCRRRHARRALDARRLPRARRDRRSSSSRSTAQACTCATSRAPG